MTLSPKSCCALPVALRLWCLPLATGVLLSACGGGGGSAGPANQPPVAAAKLGSEAVLNASTLFDTTGTADPDGSIANRSWTYGDGQSGSVDNHTYTATGSYTATLTVTDNIGASTSTIVPVTVAKCSSSGTQAAKLSPFTPLCMQTSRGELVLEIYTVQAPVSAANFLRYVDEGFYSGLLFHRVMPGFVIQSGGFLPGPVVKATTHPAIALENNNTLKNWQYTLAMARTDEPNTATATSQFFINLLDNHSLDYDPARASPNGYAVFGQVISGTTVVDAIGAVATARATVAATSSSPAFVLTDVPVQDIVIRSIVRMP